jgi:peptidyl-prolyl cis-trans isomerase B (cyclophilin B)
MAVRSRKYAKIVAALLLAGAMPLLLFGCGGNEEAVPNPVVTFTLADGSKIVAELYPDKAPNTVNNFISLVKSGSYDGKVFHRAVSGFMIQGGSPNGSSTSAGFPYAIKGEFANNGFTQNVLKHTAGVLSMARVGGMNDSGSCQFFIMHEDAPYLDNDYAAFGKVIEGMDVVDTIANSPTSDQMLLTPVAIQKATVETFGKTYAEPETLPPVG